MGLSTCGNPSKTWSGRESGLTNRYKIKNCCFLKDPLYQKILSFVAHNQLYLAWLSVSNTMTKLCSLICLLTALIGAAQDAPSCSDVSIGMQTFEGDLVDAQSCGEACVFFYGYTGCESLESGNVRCQYNYTTDFVNGARERGCTCGTLGLLCFDSVTPAPTPVIVLEEKSCAAEGVTSGDDCRAKCAEFGNTDMSFTKRTTEGGIIMTECVCGSLGTFCSDDGITAAPAPIAVNMDPPKSCSEEDVTDGAACVAKCMLARATSFSFRMLGDSICCDCIGCGVYCQDNDSSCTSERGTCTIDETPPTPSDAKSCTDASVMNGAQCAAKCTAAGATGTALYTATGFTSSKCCTCSGCGVFCRDNDNACSSPLGTCEIPPKSCNAESTTTGPKCAAACLAAGASSHSFTFSGGPNPSSCCRCTGCGVYCTDNDSSCTSDLGTCEVPESPVIGWVACFPGDATVQVEHVGQMHMSNLKLGDKVLVSTGHYESVYSFGHYQHASLVHDFVELTTAAGPSLTLTKDHMVLVPQKGTVPASMVMIGDELVLSSGERTPVVSTQNNVSKQGLFAPFTSSGTIVVNDIQASSFITMQPNRSTLQLFGVDTELSFQTLALAFERVLSYIACGGSICLDETYTNSGISTRLETPHQISMWVLQLVGSARALAVVAMSCCGILAWRSATKHV